jgi:NADPH-dependent curcumin reductase CurA
MNCEHILNSSDPDFLDQLTEIAKKFKANVCFEAVAGDLTGQILNRMPFNSRLILYGCLSE